MSLSKSTWKWVKTEKIIKNSKNSWLILKSQQRFRSEKHNVFIEGVNKIKLIANDDNRTQSIDSTETYAYGTNKEHKKENKWINII